jgi:hypothetical protein
MYIYFFDIQVYFAICTDTFSRIVWYLQEQNFNGVVTKQNTLLYNKSKDKVVVKYYTMKTYGEEDV